jgi:K+-sensing histidine kinase KdpD
MPARDTAPDKLRHDALEQLRHDLKTPLITIHGRAQLLARGIRRVPTLSEEERTRMLRGVATIEALVLAMVALIDARRGEGGEGGADTV